MIFSSLIFLFLFFPVTLICYYLANPKYKNVMLLLASIAFYTWGEPKYIFLMILSIIVNYIFGIKVSGSKNKKMWVVLSVIYNISILAVFKYSNFFIDNINFLFNTDITIPEVKLPLGISFFTFQIMSYVIDVYRNDAKVQRKLANLALYISLFPQLVAGPIVRYQTVADSIEYREHNWDKFTQGVNRFVVGLGKKVILANQLGVIADGVFNKSAGDLSRFEVWLGIVCYTLQIFYDFSGYSDMAIGLGKMFGFEFLENFNYPYISQTVSEFWRRWHISLGTWFKDYVYFPLGGNRVSKAKLYRNLFVVWFLTGMWHGTSWTFIILGLYYEILISVEKAFLEKFLYKMPRIVRHIYLLLIVMIGWVFFRVDDLPAAIKFIGIMFGAGNYPVISNAFNVFIIEYWYVIVGAILLSTPIVKVLKSLLIKKNKNTLNSTLYQVTNMVFIVSCMFIVIIMLSSSTYNPFLYFRF
ncbi:TPA: MBOAT family protein [Clostridioides difficile]|uniref:MBOAT family O-acyltransferase n=1 Tax=Clostridioides difficile TaxID=1496 RepID=UPI0009451C6D|nr:MBOAT family O-acyltransferase [Clostridioides difficile]MBJ9768343.1 MBOAT family protein [Clostridioides difficile]MCI9913558.1 MBOAT family protein [Clostridioides difficile]MDV9804304.1 MBOAT family O-acyltransferase [Clostridioides difficile]MDV9895344.1 MBOAT family O-acyltransferase [Clostridioides difficile]MDV9912254.1 MBOAT family O-acyltransferase [Clostridioides difficile]